MNPQRCLPFIAFALVFAAASNQAQSAKHSEATVVGDGCDLSVFGEKDATRFLMFDRDLREAIEKKDAGKLALLVDFPLRIDDDHGAIFIHDAASLQGHFELAFPPAIRQAILSSTRDEIGCNYAGIDYGDGRVWVNVTDRGFFLMTVNLPPDKSSQTQEPNAVRLACHTKQMRVLIDSTKGAAQRYRSWSFARSLSGSPDREIGGGTESIEGTGPCAHRFWTFDDAKTKITLEAPGCYGDNDGPPQGAQAQLSVFDRSATPPAPEWCF
jgi:hypothetical protein